MKTEFQGIAAELYDLLHSGNTDSAVYPELIKRYFGTDVLELGCGSGRLSIPLAQNGCNVTGIEYEKDMISLLLSKDYPNERLSVIRGDARDFNIGKKFDVVLLACNFLNMFIDPYDVLKILISSKRHLKPGGAIIIDSSLPDLTSMAEENGMTFVSEFKTSRGTTLRDTFTPRYDFVSQLETDEILIQEFDEADNLLREETIVTQLTYYLPREIKMLARESGLAVSMECGRLACPLVEERIEDNSRNMIFVLKESIR